MNADCLFLLSLLSFCTRMVGGSIMCSRCDSGSQRECEVSPPMPVQCPDAGSGVIKACSTVRIFHNKTGELSQFIRSCSSSPREGCFNSAPGYMTCAEICYTDGCNSALTLHHTETLRLWMAGAIFIVMVLQNRL